MHIKLLKDQETETSIKFVVNDASPEKVNALRRALMMDIPKMTIDDVEFLLGSIRDEEGNEYESISPVFDEIVAHRLGLVPIPTDLELFGFREKCSCGGEGCPSCTIMYKLEKRGPCEVYSGDLDSLGGDAYQAQGRAHPHRAVGREARHIGLRHRRAGHGTQARQVAGHPRSGLQVHAHGDHRP